MRAAAVAHCALADVPRLHSAEPGTLSVVFPAFGRAGSENIVSGLHVCMED